MQVLHAESSRRGAGWWVTRWWRSPRPRAAGRRSRCRGGSRSGPYFSIPGQDAVAAFGQRVQEPPGCGYFLSLSTGLRWQASKKGRDLLAPPYAETPWQLRERRQAPPAGSSGTGSTDRTPASRVKNSRTGHA